MVPPVAKFGRESLPDSIMNFLHGLDTGTRVPSVEYDMTVRIDLFDHWDLRVSSMRCYLVEPDIDVPAAGRL